MPGLEYQHIGHNPRESDVAIWSVDDGGCIHEDRRPQGEPTLEWLDWSHDRVFREIRYQAVGRVELGKRAGSIHISDPKIGLSPGRLARLLDKLDRKYPQTRWFLFGSGYQGESVLAALAGRILA